MGKQKTTKTITDIEPEPGDVPNTLWQHHQRQRLVWLREIEACVLGLCVIGWMSSGPRRVSLIHESNGRRVKPSEWMPAVMPNA